MHGCFHAARFNHCDWKRRHCPVDRDKECELRAKYVVNKEGLRVVRYPEKPGMNSPA